MKILYITHARIPTEKAHGINITAMSEFFYQKNIDFELILPNISNNIKEDPYVYYGIGHKFPIKKIRTVSALRWEGVLGSTAFWLQFWSFYISAAFSLLFGSRKNTLIYSRDYFAGLLKLLGYRVVYECHSIPKNKKIFFILTKLFYKIVVISKGLHNYFVKEGFDEQKIFIAPDAVKLEKFDIDISISQSREKLSLPQNKNIICYCGKFKTMGMDKGINDILKSLVNLPEDILFLAVGGSDQDIDYYQKIAHNLKVEGRVIFIGHVNQDILAQYQKAANVLLMPFPYNQHYAQYMSPIKMFEYMASQRPIIASDLETIREVLNNNNSIFCQADNPEDLADKIKYIFNNPDKADSIAKQAHQDVQKYTWDNRASTILDFIKK